MAVSLIHNHSLGDSSTSENIVKYNDFIGFTYNDVHSSDLKIVRTSDGSRFNENILPTMQDKTVQVPGNDGTYYFGSYYTQKPIPINFAFDGLTEEDLRKIKNLFGDKKIHPLILDEAPYKIYNAKVTGTATIKYIPFDEDGANDTKTIYKGEGTVTFTAYTPYAYCDKKFLDNEYYEKFNNKNLWSAASGLKETQGEYDKVTDTSIALYNPGDIDSHFQLKLNFSQGETGIASISKGSIAIQGDASRQLLWKEISPKAGDSYIKINTKLNLIEGYDAENRKTGNIYNEYITNGFFFQIPVGDSIMVIDNISIESGTQPIEYNYYYL